MWGEQSFDRRLGCLRQESGPPSLLQHMRCSLHSLKGGYVGDYIGGILKATNGNASSFDYNSSAGRDSVPPLLWGYYGTLMRDLEASSVALATKSAEFWMTEGFCPRIQIPGTSRNSSLQVKPSASFTYHDASFETLA